MSFLNDWFNHSMGTDGRNNLNRSDAQWDSMYKNIQEWYVPEGTILYRVHSGGNGEPKHEDYTDYAENQYEVFNEEHRLWSERSDVNKIDWDNHWVSFTRNQNVIGSHYFSEKGLRGFVLVIKSKKAIDITNTKSKGFNEFEVVAPMDKSTCLEILNFVDFMKKYGTGESDYEKSCALQRDP